MSIQRINIKQLIKLSREYLVLDVRSPSEFQHAHFPGANSLPLFDDEERKQVGTTYKQKSREEAIKMGLDFFGPKMRSMVVEVEKLLQKRHSKSLIVHCWRGGMRSGAVSWLLDLYGFEVFVVDGGYKSYRGWVLEQFEKPYQLRILSGATGSGKTEILNAFEELGEGVVDLEGLAIHRGSAFGGIGLPDQPSNEYFENLLALKLFELTAEDPQRLIWVESESSRIGNDVVNHVFHQQMKEAKRIHIEIPREERLKHVVAEYGVFDKEELEAAVERIERRLGGLRTKNAIQFLEEGKVKEAFEILLEYYDKAYNSSSIFQPAYLEIELPNTDTEKNVKIILEQAKAYHD